MNVAIYARVSTKEQSTDMQLPDLRRYAAREGWETVEYIETGSSIKERPVFTQMLKDAKAGTVSVILVWKIDRFCRSMKDFVNITLDLDQWHVRLISVIDSVDTGDKTPFGRFTVQLLALLAELERGIIMQRVLAGIKSYREDYTAGVARKSRSGKNLPMGRPRVITDRQRVWDLRSDGTSLRQIALATGLKLTTVARIAKEK